MRLRDFEQAIAPSPYRDMHFPTLTEMAGKINQDMITRVLNDSRVTFGFEAEFVLDGLHHYTMGDILQDATRLSNGSFVKSVSAMQYGDLIRFFYPLGIAKDSTESNPEILTNRLYKLFDALFKADSTAFTPEHVFTQVARMIGAARMITEIRAVPASGFRGTTRDRKELIQAIQHGDQSIIPDLEKATFPLTYLDDDGNSQIITDDTIEDHLYSTVFHLSKDPADHHRVLTMVAKDLEKVLGFNIRVAVDPKKNAIKDSGYADWMLTTDETIGQDYITTFGLELVSPVMTLQGGMAAMQRVFQVINGGLQAAVKDVKTYTDDTTGLHINLGLRGLNLQGMDYLKLVFLLGEEHILRKFGRVDSASAESLLQTIRNHLDIVRAGGSLAGGTISQKQIEAVFNIDSSALSDIKNTLIAAMKEQGGWGKYKTVNFGKIGDGYVEFRLLGSDYTNPERYEDIRSSIFRFAVTLLAAIDPQMFRQEYLLKLYRYLLDLTKQTDVPLPTKKLIDDIRMNPLTKQFLNVASPIYREMQQIITALTNYMRYGQIEPGLFELYVKAIRDKVSLAWNPNRPMPIKQQADWVKLRMALLNLTGLFKKVQPA